MEHLWSPWRMKYILNKEKELHCVFCKAVEYDQDEEYLILYRGKYAFVMLNRYPYTSGHLMVLPYEHEPTYETLSAETRAEMMELINRSTAAIRAAYHPQGMNVGANIGEAAGAGIAPHLHFHVVPRWQGDSNFMAVTGNTRIVPEELSTSYQRLFKAWQELFPE